MDPSLNNARVWLTGASSGIGAALVPHLVGAGARVAISARRADLLQATADAQPAAVVAVPCDVTDRHAVAAAGRRVLEALGGIDLVILNAGGSVPVSPGAFETTAYAEVFALNYFGVLHVIESVLPAMQAQRSGHLAVISSASAYVPIPSMSAYGASKAAVSYTMDALRDELIPWNIHVTVVCPGFVRTPMTARNRRMPFLMEPDEAARRIVAGLAARRPEVHFPRRLTWPLKLLRAVPGGVRRAITSRMVPRRSVGSVPP